MARKRVKQVLLGIGIAVPLLFLVGCQAVHLYRHGHLVGYGWHIDVESYRTDIGIPAVTRLYSVRLANYSVLPMAIEAASPGPPEDAQTVTYRWSVEKLNPEGNWEVVSEVRPEKYRAYTRLQVSIVPGRSIIHGWDALAALDALLPGETVRIVLYSKFDLPADHPAQRAFVSPEFVVQAH